MGLRAIERRLEGDSKFLGRHGAGQESFPITRPTKDARSGGQVRARMGIALCWSGRRSQRRKDSQKKATLTSNEYCRMLQYCRMLLPADMPLRLCLFLPSRLQFYDVACVIGHYHSLSSPPGIQAVYQALQLSQDREPVHPIAFALSFLTSGASDECLPSRRVFGPRFLLLIMV